jgi:hypothetical protein
MSEIISPKILSDLAVRKGEKSALWAELDRLPKNIKVNATA